jgi:hypothetical protein
LTLVDRANKPDVVGAPRLSPDILISAMRQLNWKELCHA